MPMTTSEHFLRQRKRGCIYHIRKKTLHPEAPVDFILYIWQKLDIRLHIGVTSKDNAIFMLGLTNKDLFASRGRKINTRIKSRLSKHESRRWPLGR